MNKALSSLAIAALILAVAPSCASAANPVPASPPPPAADPAPPAAAPAVPAPGAGEALRVFGLQKLHWGMTTDEATKAIPGLKPIASGKAGEVDLEKTDYAFTDCKFDLKLEFDDNKLSDLMLNSDAEDMACALDLDLEIDVAYQPHYDMQLGTGDALLSWKGNTGITLYRGLFDLTHAKMEFWDGRK